MGSTKSIKPEEMKTAIDSLVSSEPGAVMSDSQASDKIFTVPNLISFIRLCLVPVFFMLLISGDALAAGVVFATAALTDFLDGFIARKTNTVTKLGKLLDPVVDRTLMICGVIGLYIAGLLPLWVILFVLASNLLMLLGGAIILDKYNVRVDVIFAGKVVTTLLFLGFTGLMIGAPTVPGLGIATVSWLPGLTSDSCFLGIWLVYAGLFLGILTTFYYVTTAIRLVRESIAARQGNGNE